MTLSSNHCDAKELVVLPPAVFLAPTMVLCRHDVCSSGRFYLAAVCNVP